MASVCHPVYGLYNYNYRVFCNGRTHWRTTHSACRRDRCMLVWTDSIHTSIDTLLSTYLPWRSNLPIYFPSQPHLVLPLFALPFLSLLPSPAGLFFSSFIPNHFHLILLHVLTFNNVSISTAAALPVHSFCSSNRMRYKDTEWFEKTKISQA